MATRSPETRRGSRKASGSVPQPSHPKPEAPEPPAGTSATTPPDTLRASKGRRLKRRRSSLTAITRSAISSPMPKAQDTETTLHTEKGTDVSERGHPREGSHNQSCAKSIQEDQEANFTKAVTHIEPDAGHTGANSPVAVQNCTPNVSDLPPALSSPSSEIGRTSSIDTTNTGGRPPRLTIATNPGPSSVTSSSPVAASSLSSVPGSGVRRVPSFFRNSSSRHLDTEISGTIVSRSTKSAGLSLKGTFVEPHEEEASEKRFPLNPIPQPSTSENGKGSLPGRFLRRSTSLTLGASATSPRPAGTNEPAERPRRPPVRKVTTPVPQPPPTQIGSRPPVSASVPEPPGAYMSKIAQAFAARSRSSTKASKDTEGAVHPNPNAGTTSVASPTGATFGASGQPQNQPVDARTSNAQVLRSFLKAKESGYFVTKRSGRRHHAFPMSECPYPVACDKEALDL
ncbi:hypothetical protein FRB99_000191 [Tulasnella sp. 403]|nr:hypothetical protein FRB99_000191 [Tulasnella sp. 403]